MAEIVWFIGAGASAAFGIPTMREMTDKFRSEQGSHLNDKEKTLLTNINNFLLKNLGRPPDLESVFTIIDILANWSPGRVGMSSLFCSKYLQPGVDNLIEVINDGENIETISPSKRIIEVASDLSFRYQSFIQTKCQLNPGIIDQIREFYWGLIEGISDVISGKQTEGKYFYSNWPIFTTNYDLIIERLFRGIMGVKLETGFGHDPIRNINVSNPDLLRSDKLRLLKLHGSINWFYNENLGKIIETDSPQMSQVPKNMITIAGDKLSSQAIIYPIQQKEIFVEPYLTMFQQLNTELSKSKKWLVIGYSFGDETIREIFLKCANRDVRMIIIDPAASEIAKRLDGFLGKIIPLTFHFGEPQVSGRRMMYDRIKEEWRI